MRVRSGAGIWMSTVRAAVPPGSPPPFPWFPAIATGYPDSMDDEERRSDTKETYGSQGPPGDASNQQGEEPEAPQGEYSGKHSGEPEGGGEHGRPGNPGGAGEHSQATGHPQNAG